MRRAWRALPDVARKSLRPLRTRVAARRSAGDGMYTLGVDTRTSKCFPIPNGAPIGGIRLNLKGREPHGVLERGSEADVFCDELERDLRTIVDDRTGGPLITAVHRTDRLWAGSRRDALPDLLVEWNPDPATGTAALAGGRGARIRATSPKIGTVEGINGYGRTGEHLPDGLFICAGPGIAADRRIDPVSILDFHPTICALLGLRAPAVDGIAIPELTTSVRT